MASGTFYPAVAVGDDTTWKMGGGSFQNTVNHDLGDDGANNDMANSFRFNTVTVPATSTLVSAIVRFTAAFNYPNTVCNLNLYFNDDDDAVAPTTWQEGNALALTGGIAWNAVPAWTADATYDTPELKTILQDIIDRPGWASGQAVQFIVKNNVSSDSGTYRRTDGVNVHFAQRAQLILSWEDQGSLEEGVGASESIGATWATNPVVTEGVGVGETIEADVGISPDPLIEAVDLGEDLGMEVDIAALEEEVGLGGVSSVNVNYNDIVVEETLELVDESFAGWAFNIADALDLTDTPTPVLALIIQEFMELIGTPVSKWVGTEPVADSLQLLEDIVWEWGLVIADALDLTDTATVELGLIIEEFLELVETLSSKWTGVETVSEAMQLFETAMAIEVFYDTVSETLNAVDTPSYLHQMISIIADGLGIAETSTTQMAFNPELIEAVSVVAALSVFNTISSTNAESLGLTDIAQPGWLKSIAENLDLADTATLAWAAILALTENLELTESVLGQLDLDDVVTETLGLTVSLAMQAALQEIVTETLEFGITITLDDEQWECWVLTSNQFNASIYSGYGFNSYCVYNDVAYGAKSTGIYKLTGTTDAGDAFKPGIVLPDTRFGTVQNKRFRKAFFGLSGGTTPSIRMETDNGSETYTITSSKANISRNLKGKLWTIKIQDFDDLDFVELFPVILTR